MTSSWQPAVFDRIHRRAADPWQVLTRRYERAKYAGTLAALLRHRGAGPRKLGRVLEVGCSIGGMTRALRGRARTVLAIDASAIALRRARARCMSGAGLRFEHRMVPAEWPAQAGLFETILLSEMLYFLSRDDLDRTARLAAASLAPGGIVVLVNWTGRTDTPMTGDAAARRFVVASGLRVRQGMRAAGWRLDVLEEK